MSLIYQMARVITVLDDGRDFLLVGGQALQISNRLFCWRQEAGCRDSDGSLDTAATVLLTVEESNNF